MDEGTTLCWEPPAEIGEAESELQAGEQERAYEHLVTAGIRARVTHDGSNWALGDIASAVDIAWGEERLQQWAGDISISYPKAREVRRVARAWDPDSRRRYPSLTWSHFQVATGHKDEGGTPDAETWLRRAEHEGWSVADFREQLNATPLPPEELWELNGLSDTLGRMLDVETDNDGSRQAYIEAIRERLTQQHRRRGVSSVVNSMRDVMAEIATEGLDVGAWAWIRRVQAEYHDEPFDEAQLEALIRLGYAVWVGTR